MAPLVPVRPHREPGETAAAEKIAPLAATARASPARALTHQLSWLGWAQYASGPGPGASQPPAVAGSILYRHLQLALCLVFVHEYLALALSSLFMRARVVIFL